MDKYEELLNEKIENAKRDLEGLKRGRKDVDRFSYRMRKMELINQIEAYTDALYLYHKVKKEESK